MMKEGHRHYSEKGGHKERSDFWKDVKKVVNISPEALSIETAYLIRRSMLRDPRDGRR